MTSNMSSASTSRCCLACPCSAVAEVKVSVFGAMPRRIMNAMRNGEKLAVSRRSAGADGRHVMMAMAMAMPVLHLQEPVARAWPIRLQHFFKLNGKHTF